ncbi:MAG: CoA transferase [Chloroflexi bacterium]|nr:CoA transferase [Chloroflexota bacterium]
MQNPDKKGTPLEGLLVLDFTWVLAGPFATMILADLGADVVKVEAPGVGDFSRRYAPFVAEVSHYFQSINRSKRSLILNLKHERGRELARRLASKADVLVENFVPGTMARWGLAYEDLRPLNPRLVYASCSGFGQTGPYAQRPAFDIIVQALAGTMSITGEPGRPPVRVGFSAADLGGALFTTIGILAALRERERSGLGQQVDVSMLDAQVALLENAFTRYFTTGEVPSPLGTRHSVIVPFQGYPSKDGQFVVAAGNQPQWLAFCRALGLGRLAEDARFATPSQRAANVLDLEREVSARTATLTSQECLTALAAADVPCAPVQTIDQVVADPQLAERGMFIETQHKRAGRLRAAGSPVKMSRSRVATPRACPDLGEHSAEVLGEILGLRDEEVEALRRDGVI